MSNFFSRMFAAVMLDLTLMSYLTLVSVDVDVRFDVDVRLDAGIRFEEQLLTNTAPLHSLHDKVCDLTLKTPAKSSDLHTLVTCLLKPALEHGLPLAESKVPFGLKRPIRLLLKKANLDKEVLKNYGPPSKLSFC